MQCCFGWCRSAANCTVIPGLHTEKGCEIIQRSEWLPRRNFEVLKLNHASTVNVVYIATIVYLDLPFAQAAFLIMWASVSRAVVSIRLHHKNYEEQPLNR